MGIHNNFFKKEAPLLGLQGLGGGLGFLAGGSAGDPMSASGGTTNTYTESGNPYQSHTFTSSGAFVISSLGTGDIGDKVDVMVVAGGGGGGHNIAAGGGAGGMRVFTNVPVSTGPYPVTIGAGGAGSNSNAVASSGNNTTFALTPYGPIVASGGGGGGSYSPGQNGSPGGSGGGGCGHSASGTPGSSVASPDGISPTAQGNAGGSAPGNHGSGGGGGAGAAGIVVVRYRLGS